MTGGVRIGHSERMGGTGDEPVAPKRTFYQRMVLRDILRRVRKHHGEPLSPEAMPLLCARSAGSTGSIVGALTRSSSAQRTNWALRRDSSLQRRI
jgi:hypothetical protein